MIWLIGNKGMLGTELSRLFERQHIEYIGSDRAVDITDQAALLAFAAEIPITWIVNCAAYTAVDRAEDDAESCRLLNTLGPTHIADVAGKIGAQLIHISTDYVFAGDTPLPHSEWDLPNPQSVYGYTKLLGERYVRQFCPKSFIVRTAWLYGYHGANFVKTILKMARETGKLKVVNDQHGNPTNASDLAHHLLKLAVTDEYGVYHCTNNGECSWYEFARHFLALSGLVYTLDSCTTAEYPRPAKRPAFSSLENRMLRLTVGDQMRPWQDAITAFIGHYNKETGEIK
jgi:dTDP-4-dehydrorhamnose reductase